MNNAKENTVIVTKSFFKSLLSSFPVGSTAVEIYNELQSRQVERKIKRLEEFYSSLDVKITSVEDRVNKELLSKEDFQDVFEEATRYVILERQEKKRQYFKNILVNSIMSQDCDYDKTERYFRLLDNLTEIEINILGILDNPERYNKRHGMIIKDPVHNAYQTVLNHVSAEGVLTQLLGLKVHEVSEAATILFSNGLVVENFLNRTIETNGNSIRVLEHLLTVRGRDFVNFLKDS